MAKQVKISLIADFDPYEASAIDNDGSIKKMQFLHKGKGSAAKMGWLANENEKGAYEQIYNSSNPIDHSIMSFFNDISLLKEGTYKWNAITQQFELQNEKNDKPK